MHAGLARFPRRCRLVAGLGAGGEVVGGLPGDAGEAGGGREPGEGFGANVGQLKLGWTPSLLGIKGTLQDGPTPRWLKSQYSLFWVVLERLFGLSERA